MIKMAIITVSGKVQGVFFRDGIVITAKELGLAGWVKNESDGTVKVLAEGDESGLEKLIKYCQTGPKFAKVARLEVKWEEAKGEYNKFLIKDN